LAGIGTSRDIVGSIAPHGRTAIDVWTSGGNASFLTLTTFELWAVFGDVAVQVATGGQPGPIINPGCLMLTATGWCPDRWDVYAKGGGSIPFLTCSVVLNAWGA
jgi:hypothetical protein